MTRALNIYSLAMAAVFICGARAAERVCVEEAGGVCLKYQERQTTAAGPATSPSARRENALNLDRSTRRAVQRGLSDAGVYRGAIDGIFGAQSRRPLSSWQRANGFPAGGYLSAEVLRRLVNAEPQAPAARVGQIDKDAFGEMISGFGCRAEITGEFANIVFRRDGGAHASAPDIALQMDWSLNGRRFCIRNFGNEVFCGEADLSGDARAARDSVQRICGL